MTIYVDNMRANYGRMKMCHMVADSTDELLGDVSMLTDRRGGDGKKPLTLETLRTRELRPDEAAEMGACRCFFGEVA